MNEQREHLGSEPLALAEGYIFDPLSYEIREGFRTKVRLTPLESRALAALVCHPDEVVTYDEIVQSLYPGIRSPESQFIRLSTQKVIGRVRKKLNRVSPDLVAKLETFPESGYRWTVNILPLEFSE